MIDNAWEHYCVVIYLRNSCPYRHGEIVNRIKTDYALADDDVRYCVYPQDLASAHAVLVQHSDKKAHNAEKKRRAEAAKKRSEKGKTTQPRMQQEHTFVQTQYRCIVCGSRNHDHKEEM